MQRVADHFRLGGKCLVIGLLAAVLNGETKVPSTPEPIPDRPVQSNSVVLDKHKYRLVVDEDQNLGLCSRELGEDRAEADESLRFDVPEGARVTEIRLAPWMRNNLFAAVEIKNGLSYDYYCLTFRRGNAVRVQGRLIESAKIVSSLDNLQFLSLDGSFEGDSITITAVKFAEPDEDEEAPSMGPGFIYYDGCPQPVSSGLIRRF